MEGISAWLLLMFRKRMEVIDQRFRRNTQYIEERKRVSATFEQLSQTFSAEQFKMFLKWEEQTNERKAKEKEEIYLQGVADGFQLVMSMDDLMRVTTASVGPE